MKQIVIGIDTSCYTTSVAASTLDGQLICSCRKLLPVTAGERGLRQSDAVFLHIRQIPKLLEDVFMQINGFQIAGICVSTRPRNSDDSYMPVFSVGKTIAETLSISLNAPVIETDHQHGHFAAAVYESGIDPGKGYIALHLSGGTTDMVLIDGNRFEMLGTSLDLHAGQLIDRTGVALGLGFPAGPELEKLASKGKTKAIIPSSLTDDGMSCHLSGAEAACIRMIRDKNISESDLASEVFDCLSRTTAKMTLNAVRQTGFLQVLLAGGVSSSLLFRKMFTERIRKGNRNIHVCFGHPQYSGDNAAGVALIGADHLRNRESERK